MADNIEQIKISELPAATTFNRLVTIGTDANGNSVKVPLSAVTHPPYIGTNGHWYIWSMSAANYIDSNVVARGDRGPAFTYADFTEAQLAALKGADGQDGTNGTDGVGVSTSVVNYGLSDNQSDAPSSWSADIPTLVAGKWLWSRTVITYTNTLRSTIYTKIYLPTNGKTAYQMAVEGGYEGTEEQYKAMLANLGNQHVVLSESDYAAITTPDPDKFYMTYEDE